MKDCRTYRSMIAALMLVASVALLSAVEGRAQVPGEFPPVKDRPEVQVTPLELNSSQDDFAPAALQGGRTLVFTSARSGPFGGSGDQRIWMSTKTSTGWSVPEPANEALSHAAHVGAATLTPDGNYMIFAAYEWEGEGPGSESYGRTDLYSAERVGGEWTNVRNLGPIINSSSWDSQPTLSADGRTLYFASDRPGGLGGADIYVTTRTASGWQAPANLGTAINTMLDDMTPSIAPDSKTLFFSSNGHGGVGGFDLFAAKGGNDRGTGWKSIENLGTPINSTADEHYYVSIPNSDNAYFGSNRIGDLDIYMAYPNPFPPEPLLTIRGKVLEVGTHTPLAADIMVSDLSSGEVVATFNSDSRDGIYYVVLTRGHRYSITATAPDHIFFSDEYSIPLNTDRRNVEKDIELYPTLGGTTRLLVYFDFNKAELKDESKPDLNRAIEFLQKNPNVNVEIAGHTDSLGSPDYNKKLSQSRAESVRRYMIAAGIDERRLTAHGYGEEQPIADNSTEEGRSRNRRVEMRVLGSEGGNQRRR